MSDRWTSRDHERQSERRLRYVYERWNRSKDCPRKIQGHTDVGDKGITTRRRHREIGREILQRNTKKYTRTYIYIYIYMDRERERQRKRWTIIENNGRGSEDCRDGRSRRIANVAMPDALRNLRFIQSPMLVSWMCADLDTLIPSPSLLIE